MRVVLFGAPGSGKGTQARLIVEKFAIPQIAIGELLRLAMQEGTPLGLQARAALDQGGPVPDELLIGLIRERISLADASRGFILDGFPENVIQAQLLDQLLQLIGKPLSMVLLLETDFDALMQRVTGRRTCLSCGHICNIYTDPPKMDGQCDECGGNLRHRVDDNEEIISNRYRLYEAQTGPIIDYYREQEKVRVVQGIGEVEDIFAAISHLLEEIEADIDESPMPTLDELEKMILAKAQEAQAEEPAALPAESKPEPKKKAVTRKSVAVKEAAKKVMQKKKEATSKKPAAKKKTVTKKAVVTKSTASSGKKAVTKKAVAKKKAVVKKATAKKKVVAKKKAVTKKKVPAKKAPTATKKKTIAKKTTSKKPATKKKK